MNAEVVYLCLLAPLPLAIRRIGLSECIVDAPATRQTRLYRRHGLAGNTCPLGKGVCASVHGQQPIIALVVRLFDASRPFHIARFIASVLAEAMQGVAGRGSRPNVLVERLKRVLPTLAHGDAACAVVLEIPVIRAQRAPFDTAPHHIFRAVSHVVRGAFAGLVCRQAAATFRDAVSQSVAPNNFLVAAIAAAQPKPVVAATRHFSQNNQPIESVSDDVVRVNVHG